MSSLPRGVSNTAKPKHVNVNSLYSGRNLSASGKPVGRYGLTSVGKSIGAMRRMPPPATLPSLKSENNGQDQNVVVIMQGGAGWNKNETSTDPFEVIKPHSSCPTSALDLRPTWAKQTPSLTNSGSSGKGEFPTLSTSSQGICNTQKLQRKWSAEPPQTHDHHQEPPNKLTDEKRMLPSQYHDGTVMLINTSEREDQQFHRPEPGSLRDETNFLTTKDSESVSPSLPTCGRYDLLIDSFPNEYPSRDGETSNDLFDRENAIDKSRYKRTNFLSTDREDMVEEVRLVGNSTKHLPSYLPSDGSARNYSDFLESEEEEDIQMTKLDKLAVRVVKRVAETIDVTTDDGGNWAIIEALQKPYAGAAEGHNLLDEAVIDGGLPREQIEKNSEVAEPPGKSGSESCLPSPTPPGNVWAKRQEERESHEKEKDVDRTPSDFGLSRAALLPKRQRSSNDVRLLLSSEGTRQQKSSLRDQRLTSHGTHWRNFAKVAHKRDDRDCEVCMTVHDRRSIGGTPVDTSEQHHMNGGRPVHNGPVVQDPGFTRNTSTRVRGLRSHGRNGTSGQPQVLRRWSTYMKAFDTKTAAKSVDGQRGGEGKASQVKHTKGKNSHQQQRSRRKDPKCSMKPVGLEQPEELRSPVVSSEGYDEWETASESSTRVVREDHNEIRTDSKPHRIASFLQRNSSSVHRVSLHSASQTECKSRPMSERFYSSQNGESSSRTCPSSSDSCNDVHNINSNCRPEGVHSIEKDATDGLAGLEINDIAGVAVVDDHSVDVVTADQNDDFEEVMNKRAKKQKAHEMQAKLDAEEKRKAREKERQERTQTKKRARYNNMKKDKRDDVRKDSKSSTEKKRSKELYKKGIQRSPALDNAAEVERAGCAQDRQVDVRRNAPVTTVWNSAHVAEQKELLEGIQATIPSPIARPSPRSKSEASGSPSSIRDLVRKQLVELPVSLSSSQPLHADKYDFTFDPHLHEEQVSNGKTLNSLSTGTSSEAGSMADDFRLKEKLYKVKGFWCGEEKETDSILPSNVAKVKPQPQSGTEHVQSVCKPASSTAGSSLVFPPRSPSIAPLPSGLNGLMFSPYPVMLGDISLGRGYASIGSVVQPLISSSNTSSPPLCPSLYQQPPLSNSPAVNHHRLPMRSSYFDQGTIFASNIPQSQNMGWTAGNMLDMISIASTTSLQQPSSMLSSAIQSSSPSMMQHSNVTPLFRNHSQATSRSYEAAIANVQSNGTHLRMPPISPGSNGMVPSLAIPPPDLINMPHPVGTQRIAPYAVQYTGFSASALTHPLRSCHNISQPPPNGRFAQPPPPLQQEAHWEKEMCSGMRQHAAMFPGQSTMQISHSNQPSAMWSANTCLSHLLPHPQSKSLKMVPETRARCNK